MWCYILLQTSGEYDTYCEVPVLASLSKLVIEKFIIDNRLNKRRKFGYLITKVKII